MNTQPTTISVSKGRLWTARTLTALAAIFFLLDGILHVAAPKPVLGAMEHLGYPLRATIGIGILQLACVAVYLLPRTAMLGAILLTGIVGGAVAAHVRVGDPAWESVFGVIIGAMVWGALFLRDEQLRTLLPIRR